MFSNQAMHASLKLSCESGGDSLENRLRFPLAVVREIQAVSPHSAIYLKGNYGIVQYQFICFIKLITRERMNHHLYLFSL
ncbi:hypothetical protein ABH961_000035 [Bacillus sp. RC251]|uniref:hypothetical protein n=1 Tax=Bacillus TaxID=1386 RepID=UPI000BF01F89|nr:hypothetical protein [Bacillus wiedmannii]PEM96460.1 hypothetical protein CN621_28075 [Bacillus wiedmannii]